MTKPFKNIRFDVKKGLATLVIDQPKFANALDLTTLQEMHAALQEAGLRDDVGAVLVTGVGDYFSSGFNLKRIPLEKGDTRAIQEHFQVLAMWWHQVINYVTRIKKPVLSAVNGAAAGGGLGLVLVSDLAVCVETARFLCAWHSIGIGNDTATSYSLARIVGFRRAMELMLTNRTLSAKEALEWGMVNRVYKTGEFKERVARVAQELADAPTHLQAMAKERFHMGWRQSIEECTEFEIQNVLASVGHPHFKQILEKFVRKETRSDTVQVNL
ncbi:MAG: enoyl-CoA hydratase/isomerase family protein [Burkholderiales bacterium]